MEEDWAKFKEDYEGRAQSMIDEERGAMEEELKQWESGEKEALLKEAKEALMLEEGEEEPLDVTIEEDKLDELAQRVQAKKEQIEEKIGERE